MATTRLDVVEIYRTQDDTKAHLLQIALAEAGIHAEVSGAFLQGGFAGVPIGWSTVLVERSQAIDARKVIAPVPAETPAISMAEAVAEALMAEVVAASCVAVGLLGGYLAVMLEGAIAAAWVAGASRSSPIRDATTAGQRDDQPEQTRCLVCGAKIEDEADSCVSCGWSYQVSEDIQRENLNEID